MQGSEILIAIAQLSIAFAGFTSVVVALLRRGAPDYWRLWRMLESSLSALFFSVLPFVLFEFGLGGTALWRTLNVVLATYVIATGLYFVRRTLRVPGALSPRSNAVAVPIGAAIVIALLLNGSGLFPGRSFGIFLLGIVGQLALAASQLARVVLLRGPDEGAV